MNIKAIVIDPFTKTVTDTVITSYDDLGNIIGNICCLAGQDTAGNIMYVDDEGMLNNPTAFFTWPGYPQPLAGIGVVMGPVNFEGDNTDVTYDAAALKEHIVFKTLGDVVAK